MILLKELNSMDKIRRKGIKELVLQLRSKGINVSTSKSRAKILHNLHNTEKLINKNFPINFQQ